MIEMKRLSGGTLTSQDEILCARLSQNFLQRCACESAGMVFVHDLDSSKMSAHSPRTILKDVLCPYSFRGALKNHLLARWTAVATHQ